MQFLGSNIYLIDQLTPLYIYNTQLMNGVRWNDLLVSPKCIPDLKDHTTTDKLSLQDQKEICLSIILHGLKLFEYPFLKENVIYNPYETNVYDGSLSVFEIQSLLIDKQVAISINPFTVNMCKGDGLAKIRRMQGKSSSLDKLKGRTIMPHIHISKRLIIVDVVRSEDCSKAEIRSFYETHHQITIKDEAYLFRTDHIGKYKYIFAELCSICKTGKTIIKDAQQYASKLVAWNQLISQNALFLDFLKTYSMILTAKPKIFSLQMFEAGRLCFSNNVSANINQLAMARKIQDFEFSYSEVFLGDGTEFTSNINVELLCVLAEENQQQGCQKFLNQLHTTITEKRYKIQQVRIVQFQSTDSIQQLIERIGDVKFTMFLFVAQKPVVMRLQGGFKRHCFQAAIPVQFIWLPYHEPTCAQMVNRTIAKIAGQIGSVPWSCQAVNGVFLHYKAICLGGLSLQKVDQNYIVAIVMSINKYITKFTSTFEVNVDRQEAIKSCFKQALGVFTRSQKLSPDFICIAMEASDHLSTQELSDVLEESQLEQQSELNLTGQLFTKSFITVVRLRSDSIFRCFHLPDQELQPESAANVSLGAFIELGPNSYLLALQRDYNACPYMTEVEIRHQSEVEGFSTQLLQLIYRTTFINCQLNYRTFLPVPLQYSFQLISQLRQLGTCDLTLAKFQMMSGKVFYI